ncbi:MAG: hypothetical protein NW237_03735 [Cyanobacteriota bacterium]|nr:hypothetical protein [Cyanobacteriota bacterium]
MRVNWLLHSFVVFLGDEVRLIQFQSLIPYLDNRIETKIKPDPPNPRFLLTLLTGIFLTSCLIWISRQQDLSPPILPSPNFDDHRYLKGQP